MKDKMYESRPKPFKPVFLFVSILGGAGLLVLLLSGLVFAGPIPEEEGGYPKLSLSVKTVTPTLASPGGVTLTYNIEIRNTGALTAENATLTDTFPPHTSYNGDAWASVSDSLSVTGQTLTWVGDVAFDATVLVTFSVRVAPEFSSTLPLSNTAVITHPKIPEAVTVMAKTVIVDHPIFVIEKSAKPMKPGANKPLIYTLVVRNEGQPIMSSLPITVADRVPLSTTMPVAGVDGVTDGVWVTWTRDVTLGLWESTEFTFSVVVDDVLPETVITNDVYYVDSPETEVAQGSPYTVTIVEPEFRLTKSVMPDPPGSNREMTYKLSLLNVGSLATDLVITDHVPARVTYVSGGALVGDVVSWTLPALDTGEDAEFMYTVGISDVIRVPIVNGDYAACSAEGVCASGKAVTSVVEGPIFEAWAEVDPIAKKPGGGGGPVTPTLVIRNMGPGNAIDAMAVIKFERISVSDQDMVPPVIGTLDQSYKCGDKCVAFDWIGSMAIGDVVTFTTKTGISTIGGEENTNYTATVVITDALGTLNESLMLVIGTTEPVTGQAIGKVTHQAYLLPEKSAPPVIGRGQMMTYTIQVENTALATDEPPYPYLWESVPLSTTVISVSHAGRVITQIDTMRVNIISWTLPGFGTGAALEEPRWFSVRVDNTLVSGTQIVNDDYATFWYELEDLAWFTATGEAITTTVVEVGLIDSFKEVTPALASPGPGNVLTYVLHIVNSGPLALSGVEVYDDLPWENATYQRDAVATAGDVVSDIVSLMWTGNVAPFSEELVTMTVLVDEDYSGPLTNTATITHPDLLQPVEVVAVAYVTDKPELRISKTADPDPVQVGHVLAYTLKVSNLGQKATDLVITDTVPGNVTYVSGGALEGDVVRWEQAALNPGESTTFNFRATVEGGDRVINDDYAVSCTEGEIAFGDPVITVVQGGGYGIYLPLVLRGYSAP